MTKISRCRNGGYLPKCEKDKKPVVCYEDEDCSGDASCEAGSCVCKRDAEEKWPDCSPPKVECRQNCGAAGECINGDCVCIHKEDRWPNCCQHDCQFSGGVCRNGGCSCASGFGEWPSCCQEDCSGSGGGVCRNGECSCEAGKGTWPQCNACSSENEPGPMIQEDIPGEVGWIFMSCPQGCLTIHKVLYACKAGPPDEVQLGIVQNLCQGKESCFIQPGQKLFKKTVVCPKQLLPLMWLVYSCDGGAPNKTNIFIPTNATCHEGYKCTKESTCINQGGTCR